MANFKNIRIKMKGGKSRMQRVQVLASGKYKFVKNTSKRKSPSRTRKVKTRRKGGYKMARRKRRRGGKSIMPKVYKWIRVGAFAAPAVARFLQQGVNESSINDALGDYTGFNPREGNFDAGRLMKGWGPYLGAVLTTYGIPKLVSILRRL